MRNFLATGVIVGLSMVVHVAGADSGVPQFKEIRTTSPLVGTRMQRFRASADDRQLDHGGTHFSHVANFRGQDLLAQSFEISHDFTLAAVTIGGLEELGPVTHVHRPTSGSLSASSPWVTVERQTSSAIEHQTLAVATREVTELGRGREQRLVRVQRDYTLNGNGNFVRVRAEGQDQIESLVVQVDLIEGTFTGFDIMLGKILGFRATPTHLYIFTSAYVGYEVAINVVNTQLTFTPGRQFGDVSALLKAQAERIPAVTKRVPKCEGELLEKAD